MSDTNPPTSTPPTAPTGGDVLQGRITAYQQQSQDVSDLLTQIQTMQISMGSHPTPDQAATYNALIYRYNQTLSSAQQQYPSLVADKVAYNAQVDAYNAYVNSLPTPTPTPLQSISSFFSDLVRNPIATIESIPSDIGLGITRYVEPLFYNPDASKTIGGMTFEEYQASVGGNAPPGAILLSNKFLFNLMAGVQPYLPAFETATVGALTVLGFSELDFVLATSLKFSAGEVFLTNVGASAGVGGVTGYASSRSIEGLESGAFMGALTYVTTAGAIKVLNIPSAGDLKWGLEQTLRPISYPISESLSDLAFGIDETMRPISYPISTIPSSISNAYGDLGFGISQTFKPLTYPIGQTSTSIKYGLQTLVQSPDILEGIKYMTIGRFTGEVKASISGLSDYTSKFFTPLTQPFRTALQTALQSPDIIEGFKSLVPRATDKLNYAFYRTTGINVQDMIEARDYGLTEKYGIMLAPEPESLTEGSIASKFMSNVKLKIGKVTDASNYYIARATGINIKDMMYFRNPPTSISEMELPQIPKGTPELKLARDLEKVGIPDLNTSRFMWELNRDQDSLYYIIEGTKRGESMEPTIKAGSQMIMEISPDISNLKIGDIIGYESNPLGEYAGAHVLHRIINIKKVGGELGFVVKGDNPITNPIADEELVKASQIFAKVVSISPNVLKESYKLSSEERLDFISSEQVPDIKSFTDYGHILPTAKEVAEFQLDQLFRGRTALTSMSREPLDLSSKSGGLSENENAKVIKDLTKMVGYNELIKSIIDTDSQRSVDTTNQLRKSYADRTSKSFVNKVVSPSGGVKTATIGASRTTQSYAEVPRYYQSYQPYEPDWEFIREGTKTPERMGEASLTGFSSALTPKIATRTLPSKIVSPASSFRGLNDSMIEAYTRQREDQLGITELTTSQITREIQKTVQKMGTAQKLDMPTIQTMDFLWPYTTDDKKRRRYPRYLTSKMGYGGGWFPRRWPVQSTSQLLRMYGLSNKVRRKQVRRKKR